MWTKCNRYGLIGKRGCVLTIMTRARNGAWVQGYKYVSVRLMNSPLVNIQRMFDEDLAALFA